MRESFPGLVPDDCTLGGAFFPNYRGINPSLTLLPFATAPQNG
jgi:hypothetical protein